MYEVGQLVQMYASSHTGLILDRYVEVPQQPYLYIDEKNSFKVGSEEKIVYDILLRGEIECGVDSNYLIGLR